MELRARAQGSIGICSITTEMTRTWRLGLSRLRSATILPRSARHFSFLTLGGKDSRRGVQDNSINSRVPRRKPSTQARRDLSREAAQPIRKCDGLILIRIVRMRRGIAVCTERPNRILSSRRMKHDRRMLADRFPDTLM